MSFVTYGGAVSGHAIQRTCASAAGPQLQIHRLGARGCKTFFAHIAPTDPPTPIVGVRSASLHPNRSTLTGRDPRNPAHHPSGFCLNEWFCSHSMSFVTYGGAISGHGFHRAYGPPTGPPDPQPHIQCWCALVSPQRGSTLKSGARGGHRAGRRRRHDFMSGMGPLQLPHK
jgi:hypothetical protein